MLDEVANPTKWISKS